VGQKGDVKGKKRVNSAEETVEIVLYINDDIRDDSGRKVDD
jgi:hypothetical protein